MNESMHRPDAESGATQHASTTERDRRGEECCGPDFAGREHGHHKRHSKCRPEGRRGHGHGPRGPHRHGPKGHRGGPSHWKNKIMSTAFGVQRPLRYLAHKLELSREQMEQLVGIVDDMRTERAQQDVDNRRAQKSFAEAMTGAEFNQEQAEAAAAARVASEERVQSTVITAMQEVHALLTEEQRGRFAMLIRRGAITL